MGKEIVPFKRKLILEERINKGQSIEGLEGFVPVEAKCCSGSSRHYIPVVVMGVKLGNCEFAVVVGTTNKDIVATKDHFTVGPTNFFQSREEILRYEEHQRRIQEYKTAMRPFDYHNSPTRMKRSLFEAELELAKGTPHMTKLAQEISDEAVEESGSLKKVNESFLKKNMSLLMVAKLWPDATPDYDPDLDEEEEEEEWE